MHAQQERTHRQFRISAIKSGWQTTGTQTRLAQEKAARHFEAVLGARTAVC
jgi:hypothetical protein